jgi:hypothetical protein
MGGLGKSIKNYSPLVHPYVDLNRESSLSTLKNEKYKVQSISPERMFLNKKLNYRVFEKEQISSTMEVEEQHNKLYQNMVKMKMLKQNTMTTLNDSQTSDYNDKTNLTKIPKVVDN